jgi:hypothetical protein
MRNLKVSPENPGVSKGMRIMPGNSLSNLKNETEISYWSDISELPANGMN